MGSSFGVIDYVVFVLTLLTSLSVGIYFAIMDKRRQRNSPDDYFLAGRRSSLFPVALSFVVTFQSSLLTLSFPVEVYHYGMIFSLYSVGMIASYAFAGLVFVPVIYPLKVTSVNKYLHLRYGHNLVRYLVVFNQVVFNIFYMGTVIFGTCVAAEVIMDVPYWITVLIYTIVTTVYTSIGGIKAVTWTDVFQFLMMLSGILAVLIMSIIEAGGATKVFDLAADRMLVNEFSFNPTIRYTVWSICFGSSIQGLYLCFAQAGIQRVNSTPNLRVARIMYVISGPIYAAVLVVTSLQGTTMFGYFASKGCDIYQGRVVKNVNEMLPFTVTQIFKNIPGINGLFIASISSAALSTLSSALSSLSAIVYDDVILVKYPNIEPTKATFLSKFIVLAFGLIGMVSTFVIAKLPGSVLSVFLGFMGCIDGPTAAIFVVSVLFKRATGKGVFIGALCGMAISFWLIIGKAMTELPPDTKLPPGPTDQCWKYLPLSTADNMTNITMLTIDYNATHLEGLSAEKSITPTLNPSTNDSTTNLTAIQRIYTISYIVFSLLGFLVTSIVSLLVSCCTIQNTNIDEKCIFSFSRHILGDIFGKGNVANDVSKENEPGEEMDDLLKKR